MCLYVHGNAEAQKTDVDIEVYKVLVWDKFTGERILSSPYRRTPYTLGVQMDSMLQSTAPRYYFYDEMTVQSYLTEYVVEDKENDASYFGEIEHGLHSFSTREEAESFRKYWSVVTPWYDAEVVRCIIPVGAYYYLGTYPIPASLKTASIVTASYASNKLLPIEFIEA